MTYWNPVERYGVERFAADLAAAGGAGLITPDLIPTAAPSGSRPPTRTTSTRSSWSRPSSTDARIAMTAAACRGFVYATAVMGVTGARATTSDLAGPLVARTQARRRDLPVGVGLGVSNGDQAAEVAAFADGVIVGSAFVRTLLDHPDDRAAGLARPGRADRRPRRRASGDDHETGAPRSLAARGARRRPADGLRRRRSEALTGAVLDQPYVVPATPLTDTDGASYSLADSTDKRLTLVFFGYTHCPDICPLVMSTLASAVSRLDDADRDQVDVVFVTTDPARDTDQVLRNYLDRYDPTFIGLTGPLTDIVQVGRTLAIARRAGRPAAQRRLRRLPRHVGARPSTATTGCRSCGPRTPAPRSTPPTSTSSWTAEGSTVTVTPQRDPRRPAGRSSPSRARARASGTSARCRSAATPSRSSLGIIAAIWIGEKRWVARGGRPGEVSDVAVWAVPFGVIGGRIYHVITDNDLYFGAGGHPIDALYIWRGGLGVWGAIALGAVGVMIGAKLQGHQGAADGRRPGARACWWRRRIGRWGNWFNQELFGRPTDLPWGLEIDPDHRPPGYEDYATFHPTFLYEFFWCLAAFAVIIWPDRRYQLGHGRVLALYVMGYTLGRGWIETLRIDTVELNNVLGLRLNVWTSIVLFVGGHGVLRLGRPARLRPRAGRVRRGPRTGRRPARRAHRGRRADSSAV